MEDSRIVELYWSRSEEAIPATAARYGRYLYGISFNILCRHEDAEECVNDTYHRAWGAMPPHRPSVLGAFLGKITRRLSIDRWRRERADMRGGGQLPLALEELGECVSGSGGIEDELQRRQLNELLDGFLTALPEAERRVFLCRYWYLDSIGEICSRFGFTESKVKSMLFRTRQRLRERLAQEGY